jgi:asparagine synthase (glutamine-hydrolysing)
VLLTGDGGDDCFLGYPEHRNFYLAQRLARWIPPFLAGRSEQWRDRLPGPSAVRRALSLMNYASGGLGAVSHIHDGLPFYHQHHLMGDRLTGATVSQRAIPWSRESARRLLTEFLVYDRKTRFAGEYMTKVDGATMYYALEARAPFLDQELWNYAASLPFSVRLREGRLKAVLRELARRRMGEHVATRPKRGFSIPVQRWLAGRWRSRMEECLDDSQLGREGWIRPQAVREQLAAAAPGNWAPIQLWYLFVLEHWFRKESDSLACADSVLRTAPGAKLRI